MAVVHEVGRDAAWGSVGGVTDVDAEEVYELPPQPARVARTRTKPNNKKRARAIGEGRILTDIMVWIDANRRMKSSQAAT